MTDHELDKLDRIEAKIDLVLELQNEAKQARERQIELLANLAEEIEYRNSMIDELQTEIKEAIGRDEDLWWRNGSEPPTLDFDDE